MTNDNFENFKTFTNGEINNEINQVEIIGDRLFGKNLFPNMFDLNKIKFLMSDFTKVKFKNLKPVIDFKVADENISSLRLCDLIIRNARLT